MSRTKKEEKEEQKEEQKKEEQKEEQEITLEDVMKKVDEIQSNVKEILDMLQMLEDIATDTEKIRKSLFWHRQIMEEGNSNNQSNYNKGYKRNYSRYNNKDERR